MKYTVVGLMSGTSLDGLDLACCEFAKEKGVWHFKVITTETINYGNEWQTNLENTYRKDRNKLDEIDKSYGEFLAQSTLDFIKKNKIKPDFVASHGHTIFHKPETGFTKQIGDGKAMAAILKLPVVFDFRSLDVSLGGQGAPLVPVGDELLFGQFDFCLNLGGFANISFNKGGKRLAHDICPVNMILNYLSRQNGSAFDQFGSVAASGKVDEQLLQSLNGLAFYQQKSPKSLSREWFEMELMPLLKKVKSNNMDLLRTATEHIAIQITKTLNVADDAKVLITGGGAHNTFLVQRIRALSGADIVIPEPEIIDFKEAIIFAFLGNLKMRNEVNCLSSVTGASKDCSGGRIAMP